MSQPSLAVEQRHLPLALLFPHRRNYRHHPPEQIRKLKASLERFGQVRSIVVQVHPDGAAYTIVAGHGLVQAAQALVDAYPSYAERFGTLHADVIPADWTEQQVEGYLVADNHLSVDSVDDDEVLLALLQEQHDAGFDLASLGSDNETLRQMLEDLGDDTLADGETQADRQRDPASSSDDEHETDEVSGARKATLLDRFLIPPFSVLDARQGYWQTRKRQWLSLGIQSELGRGEGITCPGDAVTEPGLNYYRTRNAAPGGSSRPAMKLGDDGHTRRGDGAGRPFSPIMGSTPARVGRGGLANQLALRGKNGLLGEAEQARSHYKNGKGPARCYGQDLMRGEHTVGQAREGANAPEGKLVIDHYRGKGEKKATSTAGRLSMGCPAHAYDEGGEGGTVSQSGTSIFDPVLCEIAYRWFSPPEGIILDPFAGGSVRGIVAAKLGRRYVGIDLRPEQVEANEQQAQAILQAHPALVSEAQEDYTPEFTPVEEHGGILVKRDDLFQIAGVRGGKVRTVWALAQGATGLVSSGSRHSPHVHRVAAIAQRLGIPCRLHIARGENTTDVQSAEEAGAEIIRHEAGYLNVLNARAREDAEASGFTLIPFGVVCPEAVKQVSRQVDNLPADIKRLVVPVGSGITLAGILQGLKRLGRSLPVLGVCVGKDAIDVLDQYAPTDWRETVELVHSPYPFTEHPKETRLGTLPLDPTYEAKCLPYLRPGDCLWSIGLRASVAASHQQGTALTTTLPTPRWIVGDSAHLSTLCPDVEADLIFSCPPYYDLEVYSDLPEDLSSLSSYDAFLASYRAILHQAIDRLKPNRFVCLVVGDIRDKKGFYRNFVSDTIRACQDAGAHLYNEAVLVTAVGSLPIRAGKQFTASRKLGKTHQNVLVFCKGDPRQAVAACGEVVITFPESVLAEAEAANEEPDWQEEEEEEDMQG